MNSFVKKIALLFIPLITILVFVNYFGDAAMLFSTNYEKQMAAIVNTGKSVTNISHYDELEFQKEWIKTTNSIPDIVVLGSSRSMLINSKMLNSASLMNNSVRGISLDNMILIYKLYLDRNIYPKKIILSMDPWSFNQDEEGFDNRAGLPSRGKSHKTNYERTFSNKVKALFSVSYFQSSLRTLYQKFSGKEELVSTQIKYNVTDTKNPDGSVTYGTAYRESTEQEARSRADFYIKRGDIENMKILNSVSEKKWEAFKWLIKDMKNRGISINLLLTPYHPVVYSQIKKNYPEGIAPEKYLRQLAIENKIPLYGSFNPFETGLSEKYFYDAIHSKESGIKLILSQSEKY